MYIIRHKDMPYPLVVTPMSWVAIASLKVLIPAYGTELSQEEICKKAEEVVTYSGKHGSLFVEIDVNAWDRMRYFEK